MTINNNNICKKRNKQFCLKQDMIILSKKNNKIHYLMVIKIILV